MTNHLPLYRPPTQSQNAKALLGSIPNFSTSCSSEIYILKKKKGLHIKENGLIT